MPSFTMEPAISAGIALANANQNKSKNKLTMTAQNQAVEDKYKDDLGGYQLTGFKTTSSKPTNFYDTSGASKTLDVGPSQTQQQQIQQPIQQAGLTLDDLNSWWDTKQSKTDKFDQFKEFMGLMGGMGGFGGGGVPGFASGGVAAASPYNNFMGFMNAFKSLGGGNQQADISTANIN